jgi:cell division protease FtsH
MTMGGRAAEQLVFNRFTTGASDDLKKATELARKMVCQWGMSEKLGPLTYAEDAGHVFLGRDFQQHKEFSNESMRMIDEEVLEILNSSYDRAKKILNIYRKALDSLAKTLLEKETIDGESVLQVMQEFAPKTDK